MVKLTVLLACTLLFSEMSSHDHVSIIKIRSNESVTKLVLESVGNMFQGFIAAPSSVDVCKFSAVAAVLLLLLIGISIFATTSFKAASKSKLKAIESVEIVCLICLDNLEMIEKCLLPCTHYFHTGCVENWFQHNKKHRCPVCRYKVKSTDANFEHLSDHDSGDEDRAENLRRENQLREVLRIVRQTLPLEDILNLRLD